jgi:peroxiredoxin Q/BCP
MATLKEGDEAPKFTAKDQNGKDISLQDYRGKKVILYFYPKDNTPGCTKEACDFRDNYQSLLGKGFQVIGVSADSEKSHLKFIDKYQLPFPLIPDTDKEVIKSYGAWGRKKFMGKEYDGILRMTFVIDEEGKIEKIIDKVQTKEPTKQVLELLN